MSLDYLYLGFIYQKATMGADLTVAETSMFNKGIELVKKSIWKRKIANELSDAGKGSL
jgi:hypothetical protein